LIEHRTLDGREIDFDHPKIHEVLTAWRGRTEASYFLAQNSLAARASLGHRDLGDAPPSLARPWRSRWFRSGVGATTDMA
jgi:hypothetical protein